ncbi:MAG: ArsR family transcriptional regulator [Candidatus Abyssobacteria bacterium SURF_17]|uniref:ArsR family transcriptional regulator n=1 Tax=Candidatus Abyssobacteria bacterium SURF_17 TaxID=2093361 RepID=A0A419EQP1_9BACT|nr:MAG: ArsR family transcriptional regulator [Candidatus Abyssubacteria bacterium SURF_17]
MPRITPEEAYRKAKAGTALLVCAYGIEERCEMMRLEGSISRREFESRLGSVPKNQEIIFYCA